MMIDLPLLPEELMIDYGVSPEHAYYKEIRCLLSMSFIIEMTGKALIEAPKRSKHIDKAALAALDDYIETLSLLSAEIAKSKELNMI